MKRAGFGRRETFVTWVGECRHDRTDRITRQTIENREGEARARLPASGAARRPSITGVGA